MRIKSVLVGIILALCLMPYAFASGSHHTTNDMVIDVHMDENADNTCGDGKDICNFVDPFENCTFSGNPTWTFGANASFDRAVFFDGTVDECAWSPNIPQIDTGVAYNITLMAWVKPNSSISANAVIFGQIDGSFVPGNIPLYFKNQDGDPEFELTAFWRTASGIDEIYTNEAIDNDTWYHVAVVRSGDGASGLKIYVNGNLASTIVKNNGGAGLVNMSQYPFTIGNVLLGKTLEFEGIIDEARFFNIGLTQAEIKTEMGRNRTTSPGGTPPVPTINNPVNGGTRWNKSTDINITVTEADSDPYFCEVYNNAVLLSNITNMTTYLNTTTGNSAGTNNVSVDCTDVDGTGSDTNTYTIDTWQFLVKDSVTNGFVQNFNLFFDNNVTTDFYAISNSSLTIIPSELPQGNNTITVTATGYQGVNFTQNINTTQDSNRTFILDPSSLTIQVFDELAINVALNPIIKITNSSQTYIEGRGVITDFALITGTGTRTNVNGGCDLDDSSGIIFNTFGSGEDLNLSCRVGAIVGGTFNITIDFDATDYGPGANGITLRAFNIGTGNMDIIGTFGCGGVGCADIDSLQIDNTLNNYSANGSAIIQIQETMPSSSALEFNSVYPGLQDKVFSRQFNEIPNANPAEIQITELTDNYALRSYFVTINPVTKTTLDAYLLQNVKGTLASFATANIFQVPLAGTIITAQRNFGSGFVTVAQGQTDDSGLSALFLDPTYTYRMIFNRAGFPILTLNLQPNFETTKLIVLTTSIQTNFTSLFEDLAYQFLPTETGLDNTTGSQTFSFAITSSTGSLSSFGMNITYNGTVISSQTTTGSPSGGTVSDVIFIGNRTGTITVEGIFIKSGFNETVLVMNYTVYPITEGNYTLNRLIERSQANEFGLSKAEKSAMGLVALTLTMGGLVGAGVGLEIASGGGLIIQSLLVFFGVIGWGQLLATAFVVVCLIFIKWRVS